MNLCPGASEAGEFGVDNREHSAVAQEYLGRPVGDAGVVRELDSRDIGGIGEKLSRVEVAPSRRRPSSRSAWAIQLGIDRAFSSNSRDSSSAVRPARTSSAICRRNSSGYEGRLFGIVDSLFLSPEDVESTKAGQIHYPGVEIKWPKVVS